MYTYFSLLFFLHLALFSIINYPSALPFSHSILHFLLDLAFGAFSNFRFLFFLPTHDTFHMETPDFSPPHADASRPSLGFPLGTALLLLVIFTLSGIFSCCYHWDKLRSIRRSAAQALHHDHHLLPSSPSKSNPTALDLEKNQRESLSVVMPGDSIPKFIAMPCPREPPRPEMIQVKVEKPPKPPRIAIPFY
ncbi:uncharacterized protein At5g65660-like [Cucurbita pepo subsp. pepo]|uniref:uncharacterized protein At5g65660-like n=1 Tax=Cucurbita pepo subsp. pepo TaxID=3664 RepID=UPI000C9D6129|nr:uncharacterized protein At5g65660-like [Cucurbita pepo subsp. pepo]